MVRKWMSVGTLILTVAMLSGCALRERRGGLLTRYRAQSPCNATFVPYSRPMAPPTPCEYTVPGPIWDSPLQPGCGTPTGPMPPLAPPTTTEPPNGSAPRTPAGPSKLIKPGQVASESK